MNCYILTVNLKNRDIKIVLNKGLYKIEDNENHELDNVVFLLESSAKEVFNQRLEELKKGEAQ